MWVGKKKTGGRSIFLDQGLSAQIKNTKLYFSFSVQILPTTYIQYPVLKKGDPRLLENYRPVSCLPAASKLLEMIICDQTMKFVEDLLQTLFYFYFSNNGCLQVHPLVM